MRCLEGHGKKGRGKKREKEEEKVERRKRKWEKKERGEIRRRDQMSLEKANERLLYVNKRVGLG